jgi:hypothetical protein
MPLVRKRLIYEIITGDLLDDTTVYNYYNMMRNSYNNENKLEIKLDINQIRSDISLNLDTYQNSNKYSTNNLINLNNIKIEDEEEN